MSYLDPYSSSDPRGREEEGRSPGRSRQAASEDQWSRARHAGASPDGYPPAEPGHAYGVAKRANHLQVQAASKVWGERGARSRTAKGRRERTATP